MSKKPRGYLSQYRHYVFVDKDPAIDFARTAVEDSGKSYTQISRDSRISPTTLHNWFKGRTRKPQFCTISEVLLTCGVSQIDLRNLVRQAKQLDGGKK